MKTWILIGLVFIIGCESLETLDINNTNNTVIQYVNVTCLAPVVCAACVPEIITKTKIQIVNWTIPCSEDVKGLSARLKYCEKYKLKFQNVTNCVHDLEQLNQSLNNSLWDLEVLNDKYTTLNLNYSSCVNHLNTVTIKLEEYYNGAFNLS